MSIVYTLISLLVFEPPPDPCHPTPCGANAICSERNSAGACTCIEGYSGDPYIGCRPECITSSDCAYDKACLGMKCRDPCPGNCGLNANCRVINHNPQCYCLPGHTGNPLQFCKELELSKTTLCNFRMKETWNINSIWPLAFRIITKLIVPYIVAANSVLWYDYWKILKRVSVNFLKNT